MAAGSGAGPSAANPLALSGNTNISISTTYIPPANDILVIKGVSILDAIFIKRCRGKPAYITTTSDSSTVLWKVGPAGELQEIAKILWEAKSSTMARNTNEDTSISTVAGTNITVSRSGQEEESNVYGQQPRGIFSRSHSTLMVDGRKYSWHSGIGSTRWNAPNTSVVDGWKCLVAAEAPPPDYDFGPSSPISLFADVDGNTSPSRPDTTSTVVSTTETVNGTDAAASPKPHKSSFGWNKIMRKGSNIAKEIVLRFIPPNSSLLQGEFILNPSLSKHTETFLISAILLATTPGEWKYNQSTTHPRDMENVLRSDHAGDLPPYSPSTPGSESGARAGLVTGGRRSSHNLHRTVSDSRQWRWGPDFTPTGRQRRSNSISGVNRIE